MKIYKVLIIIFLGVWNCSNAQDLHFSNPESFQSYFNPAMTGGESDQWLAGLQHRNQWIPIGEGFQTSALFLEKQKKRLGVGGQVIQNKAGVSSIKTLAGNGSFSYIQPLSEKSYLRGSAAVGFLQKSFDPMVMTFDEQFVEGVGFDESQNNGEQFMNTKKMIITGAAGLIYKTEFGNNRKFGLTLGAAIHNPHEPEEGFQSEAILPMKQVLQGKLEVPLNSKNSLSPFLFYQKQGVQKELLAGANLKRSINEECDVEIGLANRQTDAWVVSGSIRWGNTKLLMAYDYNNSNLAEVTKNKGAVEIGLQMNFGLSSKGLSNRLPRQEENFSTPSSYYIATKPEKTIDEKKLYEDTDNDGVRDIDDHCPRIAGDFKNNGCPDGFKDTDRDGVPDDKDFCIHIKGSVEFNGCPDTDGDGVSDIDDRCPYLKGERESNGCPE